MNHEISDSLVERDKRVARNAAVLVIGVAVVVMFGWIFDVMLFKSLLPGLETMKFNTALSFLLTGIALLTLHSRPRLSTGLALFVMGMAVLTLSQYVTGWNIGFDEWLVRDSSSALYPGRMSPVTAFNFCLAGGALLALHARRYVLAQGFSLGMTFLALLAFAGYLYGVESLYRISTYTSMAVHTAVLFLVVGRGVYLTSSGYGFIRVLTASTVGSTMVRRLIPATILLPLFLGWLRLQGELLGLYDERFGLALFALSNVVILSVLILRFAWVLHRVDMEREIVLAELRHSRAVLEERVQERTARLEEITHRMGAEIFERGRVEKEIRDKEYLLRLLLDNLPQNVFVKDTESRFVMVNRSFIAGFGVKTEQELVGKTDADFHDAETAAAFRADEQGILSSGQPRLNYEESLYDEQRDGIRWFSTSKIPLRDGQGNVIGLVGIHQDITERRRIEDQLRQQEELYRVLVQHLPNSAVLLFDHDLRYLLAGGEALSENGFSPESIVGRTLGEVVPTDRAAALAPYFLKALSGQTSVFEWQTANGNDYLMQCLPVHNATGEIFAGMLLMQNITERKKAAEKLTQERDLLRTLIDSSPDYIFIKDSQLRFLISNIAHAQAVNSVPEALVGKTAFDVFSPELAAQFHADDRRIIESGVPLLNLERNTIDKHGQSRTVLTSKIPLWNKDSQIIGLVGISRDITDRKQLEAQQLELEIQREKVLLLNRFMMDASHDLRTPLTIMKSCLNIVKKVNDPEKQALYLGRASEGLEQLHLLIENLFTLVRLDMATSEFDLKPGDINMLAEIVCLERHDLAEQRKHTLRLNPGANLPKVMLDLEEFVPALGNLVTNALNYTPDGGEITVETAVENQQVVVRVRDNGIGISAEDLPHIFERFYRVDKARRTDTGGSGVGLTIAQKIVQAHGGQIRVESTPGEGSVFSIYLPVPAENGA